MTRVHVIPHTHWDREWYEPFQSFRLRLLEAVDAILAMLERDDGFLFTFDGQTAAVEDYLELRPEQEERIRAHVRSGRLLIGPWRILSDEFLPSGETLVRNLETGWAVAERLGGPMPVGYLPDMFGHVAQMPQILARAGLADAVVWRGVPAAVEAHAFTWVAPDGSEVRAEYLVDGYGHAAHLFEAEDRLAEDVDRFARRMERFAPEGQLLMLHGGDHTAPPAELAERVAAADASLEEFDVAVSTIPAYLDAVRPSGVGHRVEGELRSAARANVLMGVTSTRVDVKASASRAERGLERYAEPLQALLGQRWPERELAMAWARLIENSAHDSICACSHDETVAQVDLRYAEAAQIAESLASSALSPAARGASRDGVVAWNPLPRPRSETITLDVPADEPAPQALRCGDGTVVPVQEQQRHPEVLLDRVTDAAGALDVFRLRHARELFGQLLSGYEIHRAGAQPELRILVDAVPEPAELDVDGMVETAAREVEAVDADRWRVMIVSRPRRAVRARVTAPPLGWTTVQPTGEDPTTGLTAPVRRDGHVLDNGLVHVEVADDGTFSVEADGVELQGLGRLVDAGDAGDTYNYAPPEHDVAVDHPESVMVDTLADGPMAAALRITRTYAWPDRLTAERSARSAKTLDVEVVTDLELRTDERFVRVQVRFDNPSRDHRLRMHFPLGEPVSTSVAEGQFATVRRGLTTEAGHGEHPLATFPAHAFAAVDGLALLLPHVMEYEVTGDGQELALTLLRSIGWVSVNTNPYRSEPAGPQLAVESAQMLGPCRAAFAVRPAADTHALGDVLADAEAYRLPLLLEPGTASPAAPPATNAGLAIEGDDVALSALRRADEALEVRVVNYADSARQARIAGGFARAQTVSLLGETVGDVTVQHGAALLDLGPAEIQTLRLWGPETR